jgi:hypothetical protein
LEILKLIERKFFRKSSCFDLQTCATKKIKQENLY